MKKYFLGLLSILCCGILLSQTKTNGQASKPKMVIGIVVDQMRYDYITRYWSKFGEGGFKRLVSEGFSFQNAQYNYVPTYTGPGHASIYTGTTPAVHGIIANEWYDKNSGKLVYCSEDKKVNSVGVAEGVAGQMSPRNMLSSTIGDQLKLHTNQRSKVIGISLKDRSSIFPAGHSANAAYWYDNSGKFISSTHYLKSLPEWVNSFNAKEWPKLYLTQGWKPLLPIEKYTESISDENTYEGDPARKGKSVFPYTYETFVSKNEFSILRATPFGNSILKEFALECIKNEKLGEGSETDMLCISFSSTDYIGHSFGPRAVETEDTYLRLDSDLSQLLNSLDQKFGKGNYLVFLSADHGGCDVPAHLADLKMPGGYINEIEIEVETKKHMLQVYGDSLISSYSNQQFFLNDAILAAKKLDKEVIAKKIADFVLKFNGVAEAFPADYVKYENMNENNFRSLLQKGYNFQRSGDVLVTYRPGYMDYAVKGTTHGSEFSYDTHVPIIFFGWKVKKGNSVHKVFVTDIAPTICNLLGIAFPMGNTGNPLPEVSR